MPLRKLFGSVLLLMSFQVMAADADCTACHETPPVGESHVPVATTSVEACSLCHSGSEADPLRQALHAHDKYGLACDDCHGEAGQSTTAPKTGLETE